MPHLGAKLAVLRTYHAAHPHPGAVVDPLFAPDQAFFDPRDLVQVKYELLRRVGRDRTPVSRQCADFGLSRQTCYLARAAWEQRGWAGLLPHHPGPRRGYRLDSAVLAYLRQARAQQAGPSARQLALLVEQRFDRRVHPRSIERALARAGEKIRARAARESR